jgi:hypothetical protein
MHVVLTVHTANKIPYPFGSNQFMHIVEVQIDVTEACTHIRRDGLLLGER